MEKICGIDIVEPLNVGVVRDVLSSYFNQIHCASTGLEGADQGTLNTYCVEIVKKAFNDLRVDYYNPDKEGLAKVNDFLTEFVKKFHDEKSVQKYHDDIAELIDRLS